MGRRRPRLLLRILIGAWLVALLTLATHMLHAFWPYPDGPRGVEPLRRVVMEETAVLDAMADDRSRAIIRAVTRATYAACFVWTGLDRSMARFADPEPLPETDEGMRRLFVGHWEFLEVAALGLYLFSQRVAVVLCAGLLITVVVLCAMADGATYRMRRKAGGDRETGPTRRLVLAQTRAVSCIGGTLYLILPSPIGPEPALLGFALGVALLASAGIATAGKHL